MRVKGIRNGILAGSRLYDVSPNGTWDLLDCKRSWWEYHLKRQRTAESPKGQADAEQTRVDWSYACYGAAFGQEKIRIWYTKVSTWDGQTWPVL